jgi:hypothetical protein
MNELSPPGDNGKNPKTGRFLPGNKAGKGNPNHKKVADHRQTMLSTVTEEDTREVIRALIAAARDGVPWAVKEFLDRMIGKPMQQIEANITSTQLTPEEQRRRLDELLGMNNKGE